jgi:hypothetical protein
VARGKKRLSKKISIDGGRSITSMIKSFAFSQIRDAIASPTISWAVTSGAAPANKHFSQRGRESALHTIAAEQVAIVLFVRQVDMVDA